MIAMFRNGAVYFLLSGTHDGGGVMSDKKIKRWRVLGTNDKGWVDGEKFYKTAVYLMANRFNIRILPLAAVEIEYEEPEVKAVFNENGTCGGIRCPHDDAGQIEHPNGFVLRNCHKYDAVFGPNFHFCPDAVVLKSEVE